VFVDRLWTRMNPDQMEREIRARDAFWQRTAAVFAVRANEQECHHAAERERTEKAERERDEARDLAHAANARAESAEARAWDHAKRLAEDADARADALQKRLAALTAPEGIGADGDALIDARGGVLVHVAGGVATALPRPESVALATAVLLHGAPPRTILDAGGIDLGTAPAQTSLPLPVPSLADAYAAVAEAVGELRKALGPPFGPRESLRREEARVACQALGRTLEERGANDASMEAWLMARHVADPAHDYALPAIEARCRELAAGCEETADEEVDGG
ncbi:MAG TPA: hypothetical protein VLS49_07085, partial [Usitatibacter sp.]|nr:hypothetical protein [Usitatibacter sp.]